MLKALYKAAQSFLVESAVWILNLLMAAFLGDKPCGLLQVYKEIHS